jgi:hypothetical protein
MLICLNHLHFFLRPFVVLAGWLILLHKITGLLILKGELLLSQAVRVRGLERRSHVGHRVYRIYRVQSELHEVWLAHRRVLLVRTRVLSGMVSIVLNVWWSGTAAQMDLRRLLRHRWLSSLLGYQLVCAHLNLVRDIKRLDSLVVMNLLLIPSLGLVSLIDVCLAYDTLIVSAVIQNCFGAHIPVVKLVLHVCNLILGRVWKTSHQSTVSWTG